MTLYKPRGRHSRPESLYNCMSEIISVSRLKKANNGLITFLDAELIKYLNILLRNVRWKLIDQLKKIIHIIQFPDMMHVMCIVIGQDS